MTTSAGDLEITYEGEAPTFGGYASADFFVRPARGHSLEVNLGLAADAQAVFEARTGALSGDGVQAILRVLAGRVYRGVPAPTNLSVPPHRYVAENVLLIGSDMGAS